MLLMTMAHFSIPLVFLWLWFLLTTWVSVTNGALGTLLSTPLNEKSLALWSSISNKNPSETTQRQIMHFFICPGGQPGATQGYFSSHP